MIKFIEIKDGKIIRKDSIVSINYVSKILTSHNLHAETKIYYTEENSTKFIILKDVDKEEYNRIKSSLIPSTKDSKLLTCFECNKGKLQSRIIDYKCELPNKREITIPNLPVLQCDNCSETAHDALSCYIIDYHVAEEKLKDAKKIFLQLYQTTKSIIRNPPQNLNFILEEHIDSYKNTFDEI